MIVIVLHGEAGVAASIVAESIQVQGNRITIDGDDSRYLMYSRLLWTASPKLRQVVGEQRWKGYTISSPGP